MKPLIYLASPYSHPSEAIVEARFQATCAAAGQLMAAGHLIFSPIAHTHPIARHAQLPTGFDFWREYDETIISRCDELWVLKLPGWEDSVGIQGEIDFAIKHGVRVRMISNLEDAPNAGN